MKALTIWQPWASLIMVGAKPWEWRRYPAPRSLVGQRIVIHAGAKPASPAEISDIITLIVRGDSSLIGEIARPLLERKRACDYVLAVGLGTAILGAPLNASYWAKGHARSGLDSTRVDQGKWAWPLEDITPFLEPVPCRGAQGFWVWPFGESK